MSRDSATSLAPGFRFHPTDEELVSYYLKRKILNKRCFDAISVIDIYRSEPWDLPDKSKLKSRDLEWYFFSALDKKYGNGSRTNRATVKGYWKTTGKDRPIRQRERVVGMKKTLVYHKGRAPRGERTNWVMHEYRLSDETLEKGGIQQDAFVVCRVFQKSGSGPKNGEQYGAPFIEEEWENDEAVFVPGQHAVPVYEEVANDDAFVEVNDIDQNHHDIGNPSENAVLPPNFCHGESSNQHCTDLNGKNSESCQNHHDIGNPSENAVLPPNFCHGESSNHAEYSREFSQDNQMLPGSMLENLIPPSNFYYGESSNHAEHSREYSEDYQKPTDMYVTESDSKPHIEQGVTNQPEPNEIAANGKPVKEEYELDPIENIYHVDNNYLLEESYLDVTDYPPTNDGFFLEANDLSNPIDPESEFFDLDEYLTFDDAAEQPLAFDFDQMVGSGISASGQEQLAQTHSNGGAEQVSNASEHMEEHGNSDASSSKQELEATELEPGTKYPFTKKASHLLGSFPAAPAFASEFPSKDAALKLNSGAHASSSVHVMAGMIRITNMTSSGNQLDWSYSKDGNVNFVLSFTLPQGDISAARFLPTASLLSGKTGSVVARGWFFFLVFWVLIISLSLKFGTCIYAR